MGKAAFVTVGTTSFDALCAAATSAEAAAALAARGFSSLRVQFGRGDFRPPASVGALSVSGFDFSPTLAAEMDAADLVISHAGAGTVLEALGLGKALVVVVNDRLHDNHQTELAERLAGDAHLFAAFPQTLVETLRSADFSTLKPWPRGQPEQFAHWLDEAIGLSHAL